MCLALFLSDNSKQTVQISPVNIEYNLRSDPESSLIAVGYVSSLIVLYNIPESRIVSTLTCEQGATNESVNSLASHPTNGTIIAGYSDKEIRIFDVSSGEYS